jgi:sialate O-acetylesterase
MKKGLLASFMFLWAMNARAEIRLPAQMSDNMVLQQQTEANLWGWAEAGETLSVTTSWDNTKYNATADASGRWVVTLNTPKGGFEEQSITISTRKQKVSLDHVLIGEVWLCSGQSNMEMTVNGFMNCAVEGSAQDIAEAMDWKGRIRYLTVPRTTAFAPLDSVAGTWQECMPSTVGGFGAVGYYFAQNLTRNLQVPVGIINNAWGGSTVEGWLPKEIIAELGYPTDEETIRQKFGMEMLFPMIMYNGQFWPIRDYTVKGVLWYQGCSNTNFADTRMDYANRLLKMVNHWRKVKRQPDMPVYQMMLAQYGNGKPKEIEFPILREQQMRAAEADSLVYCGTILDVFVPHEINQIHPSNKRIVGRRLSYMALANTYKMKGFAKEPLKYSGYEIDGNEIILSFSNFNEVGGLGRIYDIKGVEICGADLVWHEANVKTDPYGNTIKVSSPEVEYPVAVRYGWRNFMECTLVGANGLGGYPFRTDRLLEGEIPVANEAIEPDGPFEGVWTGRLTMERSNLDLPIRITMKKMSDGSWACVFNDEPKTVKVRGQKAKIADLIINGHSMEGTLRIHEAGNAVLNLLNRFDIPLTKDIE